jgi:hypothetical protein
MFDLFSVNPTQTSAEGGTWVEYNPISSLSDGVPIEFVISGSGQDYMDLANSYIHAKVRVLRGDNAAIDPTDHVAPVNLFLHSLFSEVDIKLNDTLVSSTNNTYAYRAYLETLLTYGKEAKKSQLTTALYYKDVAGSMENNNPHDNAHDNAGMKSRHAFVENGRAVEMMGRLHSDLFFQDRLMLNDMTMRIRLVRSKDAFCLMSAQGAAYKARIVECKMLIRKVKVSPSIALAHARALESSNAKYPIRRAQVKTYTVPRGNLNHSQEQLFTGDIPSRILIGIVDNDSFNGIYEKNPFNFKHHDVTQIKLFLDGQPQLVRPIEANYGINHFINGYASLFNATGKYMKDENLDISREDYAAGYALYGFDLSPDLGDSGHFNLQREGAVRVDIKFGTALANTVNVICYAEFDSVIEVDRHRNVIFNYNN